MELVLEKGMNDFDVKLIGTKPKIIYRGDMDSKLTMHQSKILTILLNSFNREVDTDELISNVWEEKMFDFNAKFLSVRVHITEIRKFLLEVDSNYGIICNKNFCKLIYIEPLNKLEDAKNTLLTLLKDKDCDSITNIDLELINLLSKW
jgi:DNA-binding SARP family transcriptional activator